MVPFGWNAVGIDHNEANNGGVVRQKALEDSIHLARV